MSVADTCDDSLALETPAREPATRRQRGRVLPALDGIRALAVLAVMLYHFGVSGVRGGFLGVDVFFVLSGYLITGQLMTRWVAGAPGSVRLGTFWAARARRLLPGLAAFLLGTTLVVLVLDRSQLGAFRGDLVAAGTYSSNWWYVFHHTSYFVAAGRPPLLAHLWSLAVEEQFYVLWPLVVAAVVFAVPGYDARRSWLLRISVGVAVLSTVVMAVGSVRSGAPMTADPSRWYFGTDSHVMGLLTGAALAVLRHGDGLGGRPGDGLRGRTVADRRGVARTGSVPVLWTVAGVTALGLVLLACARADEFSPWLYRGGFAGVGVATAVVVAVATRPGPLARLLSIPLLRSIGQRSYALYLWHWPVACFTRPGVDLPIGQTAALLLRFGLSFLLAELSYQWVERPVREHGWQPYWGWLSSLRVGSITAPAALTLAVAGMTVGLVLPASAAPTERGYRAGGTVYVSDPAQPGGVSVEHGTTAPDLTMHGGHQPPTPPARRRPPVPHEAADLRHDDLVVYGDSVALGAIPELAARFRSVSNHAVEGVQSWTLLPELTQAGVAGLLDHDIVLVHTGDNGVISRSQLDAALASLSGAMRVILAVPDVPREWQADNASTVESVAGRYPNVRIMRWDRVAAAHPEDLWSDGVHLTPTGQIAYAALVSAAAIER